MGEPDLLTVEEILQAGEREFEVPSHPGRKIRLRRVSGTEYQITLPADPPESLGWPVATDEMTEAQKRQARADRAKAEIAWLDRLSETEIERRRQAFADADYRLIALASVSPKLTIDDARRLGHDAQVIAQQLLEFSLPTKTPAEPKADAA